MQGIDRLQDNAQDVGQDQPDQKGLNKPAQGAGRGFTL
jgi:hypothetical protein